MDGSQITGASSSYARKYALNGLFAIDDTKDSDATNNGSKQPPSPPKEYKCHDCGKAFESFVDKNGKTWSSGQVYHMSESKNIDKKARCSACMKKAGTEIVK
jgi:DNA-directed RNA polymerase subunit RPC12/RpoP